MDSTIRWNSDIPELYLFRSTAYQGVGRLKEALDDAQKASEIDPTFSKVFLELIPSLICEAYSRIGQIYSNMENYDQAEESFKLGLKHNPKDEECAAALQELQRKTIERKVTNAGVNLF